MENNSKIQSPAADSTTSNNNNNNSSISGNVVKAPGQIVPVSTSWNVVNTTTTVNTPSTNTQTLSRKNASDNVNSDFNFNYKAPMTYTGRLKYTNRCTFNVCIPNNGHGMEVQPITSEKITTKFNLQTPNNVAINIQDSMNGALETSMTVQDTNKVQTSVGPINFNSSAEPSRTVSKGIVMPAVVIPEDPRGSAPLIRPSYFIPGQAQPKTLDDEGIKMMKSGNKILLPKLEGTQGFVVPGPSHVLMQTTNKMAGTSDGSLTPKPDYSYASMICQAIFASPEKKSTLAEIYEWICTTYPFFKKNQQGWKNSIRHNLSLNAAFVRASRGEGATGKGGYWMVDPPYERYFVNGHFKPPSNETKGSCKRTKSDENEMIITNTTTAVTNKKNGSAQNPKQIARERLRQVKDNIEAAVQITLQLRGEKETGPSKKRAKVEIVKNAEKVTESINREGVSTSPENGIEKIMIRKIAEGCDEVYRRYYDGNDPNWRGDAEFFASFSPFL